MFDFERNVNTDPYKGDDPLAVGTEANKAKKHELEMHPLDMQEDQDPIDPTRGWKTPEDVVDPESLEEKEEYVHEENLEDLYGPEIEENDQQPMPKGEGIVNGIGSITNHIDKIDSRKEAVPLSTKTTLKKQQSKEVQRANLVGKDYNTFAKNAKRRQGTGSYRPWQGTELQDGMGGLDKAS